MCLQIVEIYKVLQSQFVGIRFQGQQKYFVHYTILSFIDNSYTVTSSHNLTCGVSRNG